jgi:hypothetical protein
LQFENAGLRVELERQAVCNGKGSEREAALLGKVEQLARKKAIQGLHLATMADVVLGENAEDRSDQTLVREVCRMAREYSALRADKERLDWLSTALGGYWACEHFQHRNRLNRTYIDAGMADNPTPAELKDK